MGGAYFPGSFCDYNCTLDTYQGRYNILEEIQRLVQHFQAISAWKGLYIACYGRMGVAVLRDFNHRTIQVYVYTYGLSTLTVVYSSRHHVSIYA